MAFAREEVPLGAIVYTNQITALIANVDPRFEQYSIHHFRVEHLARSLALSERPIYVVWFHEDPKRLGWPFGWLDPCDAQQPLESAIEKTQSFQVLGTFDDGMVFRIGKTGTPMRDIRAAAGDGLVGSQQPFHRSAGVEVYLAERRVVYRVAPKRGEGGNPECPCGDLRFILRVTPVDSADLPWWRTAHGHTDEFLDPVFNQGERYVKAACAVVIPLPDYDVQSLKTGNWIRDENGGWVATEWETEVQLR